MSEDHFKQLPRWMVHRLQDYAIDKAHLKGYIKVDEDEDEEKCCAICFSIWKCCTRCCCCCCCCCCGDKDEEKALKAHEMDRGEQDLHNSFAAKIEQLGKEDRVLSYRINNKRKNFVVRMIGCVVGCVLGLFAGRLFQVRVTML